MTQTPSFSILFLICFSLKALPNTTWLKLTLVAVSAVAPFVTTPIATPAAPGAVGQKEPDCNQDDSSEQGFNNRNTFKDRIAGNNHLDHVSHQPDAREGCNNSADKAKFQSPPNKTLPYDT